MLDRVGLAEPAFRAYQRIRGRGATTTTAPDGLPLPPTHLRYVVIGYADPQVFIDTGANQVAVLRERLEPALAPPARLLDFGMGCARLTRHWLRDAGLEVEGTDYNRRLVSWVRANLPAVRATTNLPEPPLEYPDGHFNAVYAVSVLTHLPAAVQQAWMQEFRRILAPGGRLVVTTHGAGHVGYMLPDERERFAAGELVIRNEHSRGSNLCNSYDPPEWVRAHLLDGFTEVSFEPMHPAFAQDLWTLGAV